MQVYKSSNKVIKAWVDHVPIDSKAIDQLRNTASMPFVYSHVAVMPDVHVGMGATIGSVVPTKGAIIPAAVGVDIGCGMLAARLNITAEQLPDSLEGLRHAIERTIPHGGLGIKGGWREIPGDVTQSWVNNKLMTRYAQIAEKHPKIHRGCTVEHLGTLGGGNHFIELCLDPYKNVWLMLHSGSRGPGNRIGQYFIEKAREDMRVHFINLPDKDLAYLSEGTEYFDEYIEAVHWAQDYAWHNRELMKDLILENLKHYFPELAIVGEVVACHHNYVARENHGGEFVWVTRKGAVRAREGDYGIIPGSMGARSYIVRGRGNSESFHSCSHGAGRVMSRGEAKRSFTVEDHVRATAGVECRKDASVLDETPGAYKDIDAVMESQKDLVEIVTVLKQVLCVKG